MDQLCTHAKRTKDKYDPATDSGISCDPWRAGKDSYFLFPGAVSTFGRLRARPPPPGLCPGSTGTAGTLREREDGVRPVRLRVSGARGRSRSRPLSLSLSCQSPPPSPPLCITPNAFTYFWLCCSFVSADLVSNGPTAGGSAHKVASECRLLSLPKRHPVCLPGPARVEPPTTGPSDLLTTALSGVLEVSSLTHPSRSLRPHPRRPLGPSQRRNIHPVLLKGHPWCHWHFPRRKKFCLEEFDATRAFVRLRDTLTPASRSGDPRHGPVATRKPRVHDESLRS